MKNITFWVTVSVLELALLVLYALTQPQCEPCIPQTDCPPCVSAWQIAAIVVGVLVIVAAVFLKKFRSTTSKK